MADNAEALRPKRAAFAVGTAHYAEPEFRESEGHCEKPESLCQSIERSLHAVFAAFKESGVDTELVLDPSAKKFYETIKQVAHAGDLITVYYTGHGKNNLGLGYYLVTTDYDSDQLPQTGVKVQDVPTWVLIRENGRPRQNQPSILLILDCCYSGAGGEELLYDALMLLVARAPTPNLWVLATATRVEEAVSGVFATALAEYLQRPNVGASTEFIALETVLDVVVGALETADQHVELFKGRFSTVPKFFPNVNFAPGVAGLPVQEQHWIVKARGAPGTATGFYLTGRTGRARAAADLARWITDPTPARLMLVTGSPGSGKSALLSLAVMLTDPARREELLAATAAGSLAHQTAEQLPATSRVVAVYARGQNADQVAHAIATGMGRPASSALELLESLDELPPTDAPVIIIDGVDEARKPTRLRDSLLIPLVREHGLRVAMGARRHTSVQLAAAWSTWPKSIWTLTLTEIPKHSPSMHRNCWSRCANPGCARHISRRRTTSPATWPQSLPPSPNVRRHSRVRPGRRSSRS
jgi:hypothetical protein